MESTAWLRKLILGVKIFIITSKVNKANEVNFKKRISSSILSIVRRKTKIKPLAYCLPFGNTPHLILSFRPCVQALVIIISL